MILRKYLKGVVMVPMLCLMLGNSVFAQSKVVSAGVDAIVEVEDVKETPAYELLSNEEKKDIDADANEEIEELQIGDSDDSVESEDDTVMSNLTAVDSIENHLGTSLGMFKLTAYCPCKKCNGNNPPVTRMGTPLIPGQTIAVDRRVIPLGTWVYLNIPGQGWTKYRAEDTGSGIKGNRIDVLLPTHGACYNAIYNSTVEVRLAI